MPALLRRLSATHDVGSLVERSALPRALGWLALPAALLGAVWLALPHDPEADVRGVLVCVALGFVLGAIFHRSERLSPWGLSAFIAVDTLVVAAACLFGRSPLLPIPVCFLWLVPATFSTFGLGHALLHTAFAAALYAVVLALLPDVPGVPDATAWTAVTLSIVAAGLAHRRLRLRFSAADRRFRRAFEATPVPMAMTDRARSLVEVNDAFCALLGRPRPTLVGTSPVVWSHLEDAAACEAFLLGDGVTHEQRFRHADGRDVWTRITRSPIRNVRGDVRFHLHHVEDVTARVEADRDRRAAEAALAHRAQLNRAAGDLGRLAVEIPDPARLCRRVAVIVRACLGADVCSVLEGHDAELRLVATTREVPGRGVGDRVVAAPGSLTALVLAEREPVAVADVWNDPRLAAPPAMRAAGLRSALGCALRRPGDTLGFLGVFDGPRREWRREEVEFVSVAAAVLASALERTRSETEARRQALHDPLTGLPNRALFRDRLETALAHVRCDGRFAAVILLDLDGFKVVNDSLGHHAADDLLRAVAPRLAGAVRATDSIARLGGDEFAVLATDIEDADYAMALGRRLQDALAPPVAAGGAQLQLSASVGVAIATADSDADGLLRDADAAMYHAKRRGRNRVERFDSGLRDSALRRLALEQDVRRALEAGELHLAYQPIHGAGDRGIAGFEALLRWTHPEHGPIRPDEFIGVAEESGLIRPIGRWVLRTACEAAAGWPAGVGVAVNLSARQVTDPDLGDHVAAVLRDTGLPARRLTLEITESTLMEEGDAALSALEALRATGVHLSLDDFGTGYSSLSYLRSLPLNALKIDRSFVRDLADDPAASALVEAVVRMARALDLVVVAEGIETQEQLDRVRELGCDRVQGYLLGRPVPVEAVRARFAPAPA